MTTDNQELILQAAIAQEDWARVQQVANRGAQIAALKDAILKVVPGMDLSEATFNTHFRPPILRYLFDLTRSYYCMNYALVLDGVSFYFCEQYMDYGSNLCHLMCCKKRKVYPVTPEILLKIYS